MIRDSYRILWDSGNGGHTIHADSSLLIILVLIILVRQTLNCLSLARYSTIIGTFLFHVLFQPNLFTFIIFSVTIIPQGLHLGCRVQKSNTGKFIICPQLRHIINYK